MKLYEFRQNNSGGSFHVDDNVSYSVLIEAKSAKQANKRAKTLAGIYFNGCRKGADCSCCGDRWNKVNDDEYDCKEYSSQEEAILSLESTKRGMFREEAIVYFSDGLKEESTICMKQEDIPKVNSLNITPPDKMELDWTGTILHMISKSPEGSVEAPCTSHEKLLPTLKFIPLAYIHDN